ncbi:alpha-N-arabinofuranosidase [Chryseobacterium bernardetii]|uniref:Alpha-N-arabinofuranosidase n=2 Tax=Chryseobacterium TaxID=59732 RepID=A0A543EIK2_9FLAO|nr:MULTISPECIES: glycoside hydrolase family 43 protein [Chryseobacterium]MDR6369822.1 alpha-N-arabinofuranosidase [Chryseobacterium vietnamense]MDR6440935.1 alpha-N-arabinofuranosidase [Chryseobacterium bernardetii]TQM21385.1 alpha-N-arabinofuranosidase [Chryseobacterium aquifrigidense]
MKQNIMNLAFFRNKTNVLAAAALLSVTTISAQTFSDFNYRGNDKIYNDNPLQPGEFYSPILQGCYPDPSITRKGEDYYLVNSSFSMFPGVPIFTSKDLVNWKQVGHVLDRPSQLKVEKSGVSHGIYAPDIKYNKHNDTFYMITTQFAGGIGNMVVKTKDPAKGWSEVQKLNFEGIDPAIFFDDDGKAYIVHNDAPPQGTEQYNGHRVIKMWDYDLEKDQVVAGSDKIIVNGGVDLSQKPIWIEGPHIYKKNGKYYLMCAEGGTGGNHSEVIFMSDSPKGPYVPAGNNPILTQRYFPKDRKEKVDWAGHADLVETPDGQYYGVFLAIRPNEKNRVNKGRETFILPVDWSGKYPVFQNGLVPMKPKLKLPAGVQNQNGQNGFFPNGNFTYKDKLIDKNLDFRWIAMRGPRESFITVTKNGLKVNTFTTNIKALAPVSALFHRLQHESFETSVTLDFKPKSEKELAGITCYQSETFNYVFGITKKDKDFYIVLERTEKGQSKLIASEKISLSKTIKLQVVADKDEHSFNYSLDGKNYKNLGGPVSGDILSTDVAGGFTGSLIGLYSTSSNDIIPN